MPPWSGTLRNLYWFLRYQRVFQRSARRRYYRKIALEKKRLQEIEGVDQEEIRLLCRYLSNLKNKAAEQRYLAYSKQLKLPF